MTGWNDEVALYAAPTDIDRATADAAQRRAWSHYPNWLDYAGYGLFHAACAGVLWTGVTAADLILCAVTYVFAMMGATLGLHRYFAHRIFKTRRWFQLVLAVWGTLSLEKGPLWWASVHRHHHRYADTPRDVHSPLHQGYLFAYAGWFLDREIRNADMTLCPEFARYPELIWLSKYNFVPAIFYATGIWMLFGWSGLVWGFFVSTVLVWHGTHIIASLLHGFGGYRRFPTSDNSRNRLFLSLLLMGDGYHNNHHYLPYSARCGFAWWEIDINWLVIKLFRLLGLVWDVRVPPPDVVRGEGPSVELRRQRFERWLSELRLVIGHAAAGEMGDADVTSVDGKRLRHTLDARIDTFAEAAQHYLLASPDRLRTLLADLRRDLLASLAAFDGYVAPSLVAKVQASVSRAVDEHVATSHVRHLFVR